MAMPWSRAMAVWFAVGLTVVASLGIGRLRGAPPSPDDAVPVQVRIQTATEGEIVVVTLTLVNRTDAEVRDLYLAGRVPAGATFIGMDASPAGSWFRGYEGVGTSLQAAVWLAERLPPRSDLGPFRFRVRVTGDGEAQAQGWVHWQAPTEGTAISFPAVIAPRASASPPELTAPPTARKVSGLFTEPRLRTADLVRDLTPPPASTFRPWERRLHGTL